MKKGDYKKEYIFAVQKKTNDLQSSKENNRGCVGVASDVKDSKDGAAAGVAKQSK